MSAAGGDRLPLLLARGAAVRTLWWCRPLRDAVNRWVRPYQGELGPVQLADYIEGQLRDCFAPAGVDPASLAAKSVLEVGPGGNFGLAAVFLGYGARRVVCLDHNRLCFDSGISSGLFEELNRRFGGSIAAAVERAGDRCRLRPERFEYCVDVPIEEASFADSSFDFVFSCACLEHVGDPPRALAAMHRVLRPSGRMLHQIDFRDHRDFARPLEFLRYSDSMWRWISAGSFTNRWRPSQFRAELARAGFATLFATETGDEFSGERVRPEYLAGIRPYLQPRFAALGDEELSTLGLLVLCEKKG